MEEKFLPVVNAILALNSLGCSYNYEFYGYRLNVCGIPSECGLLLGLLWSKSNDFTFYPCEIGVEVYYQGEI